MLNIKIIFIICFKFDKEKIYYWTNIEKNNIEIYPKHLFKGIIQLAFGFVVRRSNKLRYWIIGQYILMNGVSFENILNIFKKKQKEIGFLMFLILNNLHILNLLIPFEIKTIHKFNGKIYRFLLILYIFLINYNLNYLLVKILFNFY